MLSASSLRLRIIGCLLCLACVSSGSLLTKALGQASDKEKLRKALGDVELAGPWIYDDVPAGFALARKNGKPLLVVFR